MTLLTTLYPWRMRQRKMAVDPSYAVAATARAYRAQSAGRSWQRAATGRSWRVVGARRQR